MGQKQCAKCSEMVDEAKAFCPGCGNAFVEEEKRQATSGFDAMDHTVQLGNTMYNQMLSDMGLNISKTPEVSKPIEAPRSEPRRFEVLVAVEAPEIIQPKTTERPNSSGNAKWLIMGGVLLILIFAIVLIVAAVFYYYLPHLK